MRLLKKKLFILPVFFCFLSFSGKLSACTLWAASGDKVEGGGSLLAKNRDYRPAPDQVCTLETVKPSQAYEYTALIRTHKEKKYVKAGVNEKGLAIVSSTASSVEDDNDVHTVKNVCAGILASCDSVDAALGKKDIFSNAKPFNFMLADKNKIALVEIGPEGKFESKIIQNGTLCQTNHYILDGMKWANEKKIGRSSLERLKRIEELLNTRNGKFTLQDFIRFSEDRNAGPDNSIWRTGSSPKLSRTLATWIIHIPENGKPVVYLKTANPGEDINTFKPFIPDCVKTKN
ncbi:MAG: hypothetical protein A2017_17585 [Lentisphaerae bacterium GWF2_44_16]|nr:MAG: hypothetical protein A2017_17585 [Lentisphaerae bacterium GWF2_44_16]